MYRVSNVDSHAYLNTCWVDLHDEKSMVRDPQKVIVFQGYLEKHKVYT